MPFQHPATVRALRAAAACLAIAFVALSVVVVRHPGPFGFDRSIALAVQGCTCTWMAPFTAAGVTLTGVTEAVAALAVVALIAVLWRAALPFAVVALGYSVIWAAVVLAIHRPRPAGLPHATPTLGFASYPSGHMGFFLWLAVLAMVRLRSRVPAPAFALAMVAIAAVVVIVGAGRVYVSAHWPSDVLGGWLLAGSWLCLTLSIRRLTAPLSQDGRSPARTSRRQVRGRTAPS